MILPQCRDLLGFSQPQCGQSSASVDTEPPHSLHLVIAIDKSPLTDLSQELFKLAYFLNRRLSFFHDTDCSLKPREQYSCAALTDHLLRLKKFFSFFVDSVRLLFFSGFGRLMPDALAQLMDNGLFSGVAS